KLDAKSRCSTKFESVDAQFCSSDSFAAACAIAHLCLKPQVPLPAHDESGSACVQHAHREYAPPENASECAPTVRPSAESFLIYSGSTAVWNLDLGSSLQLPQRASLGAASTPLCQSAEIRPVTLKAWPVILLAAGEARKTA